jgi:alkylation response protein AidB-like acyl-CoA dehydrogenase
MSHYKSNLRDITFNLFEVNQTQQYMGKGPFGQMDEESARTILAEVEKLCADKIAASFKEGDQIPCTLKDGNVTIPAGLSKSIQAFFEGEWHKLEITEARGGYGATPSLRWATLEMIVGANPAVAFYIFGTFIATVIDRLGTPAQKDLYVQQMLDRRWGGTMVLTEPDAGSDVGAGRTKARHIKDDLWELKGVKRFITNGDFDTVENVVHLVLARPEGGKPGTKGLSLFIVPKFWVNADGSLGERNGAVVTNVEKKMGIKGSATCELALGDDTPCHGLLVGNVHDGIAQMFNVIEHARMFVGLKSMSTLSTGYLNALAFTKERVQGTDLGQMMDKAAPKVAVIRHPDVRRMLLQQKSHVEGMRALIYKTAAIQDQIALATDHAQKDQLERLNDLMLPLVKGYCSEKAYELLAVSLQCFGGSGFCQDYPIEQYIRDQKIDSLYEGTTHIQALDLFFRKIGRDQGATLKIVTDEIRKHLAAQRGGDELAETRSLIAEALDNVQGMLMGMAGFMGRSIYLIGLNANRVLESIAETVIAGLLLEQAAIAQEKLPTASGPDAAFYQGKIASAKFFAKTALPMIAARRRILETSDLVAMELPDAAFGAGDQSGAS